MLATALGEAAGKLLLDETIIEIMLNPDGDLWIERLGHGRLNTGYCPASAESEHFKNLLSYKSSGELRGGRYGEAKEEKTI